MSLDRIWETAILLGFLAALLLVLGIGCAIADYVFPHILPLRRYLDSLPDYEDDEEIAKLYNAIRRAEIADRKRRRAARKNKKVGRE